MANGIITQIELPSGNVYDIHDARVDNINNWDYQVCTNAANTPKDVTWTSGSTTITGTLVASDSTMYKIYLVPDSLTETKDIYEEYITVRTGTSGSYTYTWEKMGDTDIDLSVLDKLKVTVTPHGQNASSSVTFGTHTKATVLKSSVTATVPKPSGTTKYLVKSTDNALTDLGTPSTTKFVTSYPGATSKLNTTTVLGVKNDTVTASKATAGTAKAIAKTGTAVNAVTSFTAPGSGETGNLLSTATVASGTTVLKFNWVKPSTTSITPAVSNGNITPYTFENVTVPVKADSATTVAIGTLSANGGGASVMTGLGTASTSDAVTGYPNVASSTFLTDITSASSTSTGAIKYVETVSTSGTNAVTFATSGNTAEAITALGAATAAAQNFTGTQETWNVFVDNS